MARSFTDLEVYQTCRSLRKEVSALANTHFPPEEKYRLTNQIIRSSRSITASLAEGYGRYYYKEHIQYCRISRGSLLETLEHLITATDEGYITAENLQDFRNKIDSCGKLLNGYINYLRKSKPQKDENQP